MALTTGGPRSVEQTLTGFGASDPDLGHGTLISMCQEINDAHATPDITPEQEEFLLSMKISRG
ncbi:hypothetical protein ACJ6WE_33435 [Streptomyces sp. MMS24-I31]|uniref:hypothetical protein n=1 Tax=Streptomyces sp. MMS24-I31 TaxID=3351563 RepID=UPI003896BDDF